MKTHKLFSIFRVAFAAFLGAVLLASLMIAQAQTTTTTDDTLDDLGDIEESTSTLPDTLNQADPANQLTAPAQLSQSATPAPMVIESDSLGNILIRGEVAAVDIDTLTIVSWGGTWTVRADGLTSVIPSAQSGIPGDLSAISIGDFVGVDGAVAQDQAFTVDATLVRDWTTNPFTGSDFAPAPGIEGASTGTSDVSLPQSTEDVSTEPAPLSQSLDGDTSMEDESGTATTTDGADTATEEPTDESDLTYRGSVDSVDSDANTFTFTDDFDSTYTVNVDQNTSVVNNDDEIISLEDVAEGDRVDVEGAVDGSDITATFIRNIDDTSGLFF